MRSACCARRIPDQDAQVSAVALLAALSLPVGTPRDMKRESVPAARTLMPRSSHMVLIDANILMYAAGAAHPNKQPSIRLLERVANGEVDATINAETLITRAIKTTVGTEAE